jgi:hypothetical protein
MPGAWCLSIYQGGYEFLIGKGKDLTYGIHQRPLHFYPGKKKMVANTHYSLVDLYGCTHCDRWRICCSAFHLHTVLT